jgi:hypothetical protein
MTHNIGRNDPCPCGSGKKYKKCCLNELTVVSSSQIQDIRNTENKLMTKIEQFCEQAFNSQMLDDAWGCFVGWTEVDGGDDPTVLPESGHMFNVWRQFHWNPAEFALEEMADDSPNDILATLYQQKRPIGLDDRDFILAAMSAPFCFYQVLSVVEGKSMVLKNLFTDEQTEVVELRAARPEHVGDMLFTTVVNYKDTNFMLGTGCYVFNERSIMDVLDFKQGVADNIEQWSHHLIDEYEPELLEMYWGFREELFNPGKTEVTMNTSGPVDLSLVSGAIGKAGSGRTSNADEVPNFTVMPEFANDPQVAALMDQIQLKHWQDWADIAVPALDNKIPRTVAKTEQGRSRLEALLLTFEFSNPKHQQWLYKELGLNLPGE